MGIVSRNLPQGNNMKFLLVLALAAYAQNYPQGFGGYPYKVADSAPHGDTGEEKLPPQLFRKREASPLLLRPECRNRYGAPVPCADPEPMVYEKREADPQYRPRPPPRPRPTPRPGPDMGRWYAY